jgi:hypothetical protein
METRNSFEFAYNTFINLNLCAIFISYSSTSPGWTILVLPTDRLFKNKVNGDVFAEINQSCRADGPLSYGLTAVCDLPVL